MFNDQLELLINAALADGELTEKEKQILFKKAEAQGIDLDEFEMILDGRLYEKLQSLNKTHHQPIAEPISNKLGDVKKCPACGASVDAFQAICSDCGHEYSNIEAINSTQKIYNELMRVEEEERNRNESNLNKKRNDSAIDDMLLKQNIWSRKSSVVSAFPIPNTKSDILEFLSLAVSEGSKKISFFFMYPEEKTYIKTWRAKAEQVVIKARFSLKDDKKLLEEIDKYAKQLDIK
jgi:hypothetical protein